MSHIKSVSKPRPAKAGYLCKKATFIVAAWEATVCQVIFCIEPCHCPPTWALAKEDRFCGEE